MKNYYIDIEYTNIETIHVQAENKQKAIKLAKEKFYKNYKDIDTTINKIINVEEYD